MKKGLIVLIVLALIATPVFAKTNWSVGLGAGFPSSHILGAVTFDVPISLELGLGVDYNYNANVGFSSQFYGTYGIPLNQLLTLQAGLGATARIVQGFYIAPAARVGLDFNLYANRGEKLPITPFIRGDFGCAIQQSKFFWQVQAGAKYTF